MNPFEDSDIFRPVTSVDDSLFAPFAPTASASANANDPLKGLSSAGDPVLRCFYYCFVVLFSFILFCFVLFFFFFPPL